MPFEGYWVEVYFPDVVGSRALGHDAQGYFTTSEHSATVLQFKTYSEAAKAIEAALAQWSTIDCQMVIRFPGPPEPVYYGPRPTAWEKILDDKS